MLRLTNWSLLHVAAVRVHPFGLGIEDNQSSVGEGMLCFRYGSKLVLAALC
jgi:hypothetical protein